MQRKELHAFTPLFLTFQTESKDRPVYNFESAQKRPREQ